MRLALVLDMHYLCYRAFHTTGTLSYRDRPTGVLYGLFRDLVAFADLFQPELMVFCFDAKPTKRLEIYPEYKANRRQKKQTAEEREQYRGLQLQIKQLRTDMLPRIGFQNILFQRGYEADDLIAAVTKRCPNDKRMVIVGADSDLLQLLRGNVAIYNPKKKVVTTAAAFRERYGIEPKQWADVRALTGCSTDNVPGLKGVGEKTALRFVKGELPQSHRLFKEIKRFDPSLNLRLVKLPFQGATKPKLKKDSIDQSTWQQIASELGMGSLERILR